MEAVYSETIRNHYRKEKRVFQERILEMPIVLATEIRCLSSYDVVNCVVLVLNPENNTYIVGIVKRNSLIEF